MIPPKNDMPLGRRTFLAAGLSAGAAAALPLGLEGPAGAATGTSSLRGIIDIHAHAILPSWRAWLAARSGSGPLTLDGLALPDWTAQAAIEVMDAQNIQAMILSNPAGTTRMTREEAIPLARRMNEEFAGIIADHPRRFGAFAVLPLQDTDATLRELDHALGTLGLDGVCLPTNFEGAYPGDARFEPILAELDRRRATAFVHPQSPSYASGINIPLLPGVIEYMFDVTRAVVSLVVSGMRRRYPNFHYVATHGGGTLPFVAHRAAFMAARHNPGMTYDSVMEDFRSLHYDLVFATARPSLAALREFVPVEHLLMGTDFPFAAPQTVGAAISRLAAASIFNTGELQAITTQNPLPLLPRFSARMARAA